MHENCDCNKDCCKNQNAFKKAYTLELMTTLSCDMRCHYCFGSPGLVVPEDHKGNMSEDVWNKSIDLIDNIKTTKFFENYDELHIMLFGGEPTLSIDRANYIIDRYKDNDDINFYMVTNGQHLEEMKPLLDKYALRREGRDPKLFVQISYDGNPINDIKRRDCHGNITSEKTKAFIKYMQDNDYVYTMKATVTYDTLKYLHDAYLDFINVSNGDIEYFPTIDQSEFSNKLIENIDENKKEEYKHDLERELLKIAKDEINNAKKTGFYRPRFQWFTDSKPICAMGHSYICIGTNGNIYPCHGTAYIGETSKICSIFDSDYPEKIFEANRYFGKIKYDGNKCEGCTADYCLKCPSESYKMSKMSTDEEKYTDYGFNEFRCSLYKMSSKIKRAVEAIVK